MNVPRSGAGSPSTLVIAGAGYAGLRIAQRAGEWLGRYPNVHPTLVDRHDYHQLLTELPRVASGSRAQDAVRIPVEDVLSPGIRFVQTAITGLDVRNRELKTEAGPLSYTRLVLALGSESNDYNIPGLRERAIFLYSADGAQRVWNAVNAAVRQAATTENPVEQQRLMTVVVGGGGATGVEFAGGIAEKLPALARRYGVSERLARVILLEAGDSVLAGSSAPFIARATALLRDLKVDVRTNARIKSATAAGLTLADGEAVEGGMVVWAGGVKPPAIVNNAGLRLAADGRVQVDRSLRAVDHPDIYVAGDMASIENPGTGRVLPALAQVALEEGDAVSRNLEADLADKPLRPFTFFNKGYVISVGDGRGAADLPGGVSFGGRLAHVLKDGIEWDYRRSVRQTAHRINNG